MTHKFVKGFIYLGGPINGCSDGEANDWRSAVKPLIEARGYGWIDPMDRDYRGREMEPGIAAEIVENDKRDIKKASLLLMNCPKPSVGTSMEILYGYTLGLPVIAVIPSEGEPSPWLVYHTIAQAHTVEGALNAGLREIS